MKINKEKFQIEIESIQDINRSVPNMIETICQKIEQFNIDIKYRSIVQENQRINFTMSFVINSFEYFIQIGTYIGKFYKKYLASIYYCRIQNNRKYVYGKDMFFDLLDEDIKKARFGSFV